MKVYSLEKDIERKHQNGEICIGTWAWGEGKNGSKMIFGKSYSQSKLEETFNKAYDAGYKTWDTAEVYGMGSSEKLLKNLIAGKGIFLSTKHAPQKKYEQGEVKKSLDSSLERLGREYVDLYWLHSPLNIEHNMSEMAECAKEGKIKNIGLSNGNIEQIKLAQNVLDKYGMKLYAVQNHYSLLSMEREEDILSYCKEQGINFWGYMILEQGALSGHYDANHHFPLFSMRGLSFGKSKFNKIEQLIYYEQELAAQSKIDPSQIPVLWARAKGVTPIVGITKPSYVDSMTAAQHVLLEDNEIDKLQLYARESGVKCKGIWE